VIRRFSTRGLTFLGAVTVAVLGGVVWVPGPTLAASHAVEKPSPALIRKAQQALKDTGHDPGPIDGVLGPRVRAALRSYQQAEGLRVTGRLDSVTVGRLGIGTRPGSPPQARVLELQKALAETGHDPGPLDGIFGTQTKAALRSYVAVPPPSAPNTARDTIERFQRESQSP
jgi:hypothetical protein